MVFVPQASCFFADPQTIGNPRDVGAAAYEGVYRKVSSRR
jgi:hypothetical protein